METLDELEKEKDETLLRRVMLRAPDPELQKEARRRIIRLHIAASPLEVVREHAADVEARVLATGRNTVDPAKHPATAAWLDPEHARVRGVLVRQDVWKQTATLLAYEVEKAERSVVPSVDLRGALFARIDGLKEPVTLCAPPDTLDVTPCLLASEVKPKVPIVYIDDDGLLHFVERVTSRDATRLVYETPNLPLPFDVGGKPLLTVDWPIVFERPDDVIFSGPPSGRGPDLRVIVERRYSPRLFFQVDGPEGKLLGVVEANDSRVLYRGYARGRRHARIARNGRRERHERLDGDIGVVSGFPGRVRRQRDSGWEWNERRARRSRRSGREHRCERGLRHGRVRLDGGHRAEGRTEHGRPGRTGRRRGTWWPGRAGRCRWLGGLVHRLPGAHDVRQRRNVWKRRRERVVWNARRRRPAGQARKGRRAPRAMKVTSRSRAPSRRVGCGSIAGASTRGS